MIVVGTAPGREDWLADCLASLPGDVLVVRCDGYEPGKLRWVLDNTTVERFWFLQDSVVVHDPAFLADGLERGGAVSLSSCPAAYGSFMGVYDRALLRMVPPVPVDTKEQAIFHEVDWTGDYVHVAGSVHVMFPDLHDRNAAGIERLHGRDNLVLRNEHLTKFKGTWR